MPLSTPKTPTTNPSSASSTNPDGTYLFGPATAIPANRRRHIRHKVDAPCKIIEAKSGRTIAGTTRDVSLSGLLVALRTPVELKPGDRIRIGVAWRGQAVIDESTLSDARITRAFPIYDGQQTVAIERIAATASQRAAA